MGLLLPTIPQAALSDACSIDNYFLTCLILSSLFVVLYAKWQPLSPTHYATARSSQPTIFLFFSILVFQYPC